MIEKLNTINDVINYITNETMNRNFYGLVVWIEYDEIGNKNKAGRFKKVYSSEFLKDRNFSFTIINEGVISIHFKDAILNRNHKNTDRHMMNDHVIRIDYMIKTI